MSIQAGQTALASDFVSTSSGASDSGKVAKLNASGLIPTDFINDGRVITYYTTQSTFLGDSTTRFDVTNPSGTTFRYTYDGTGTNPSITSSNPAVGAGVNIQGANFSAGNKGSFVVTASGTNYFEVTNASGVAENDKTLGAGFLAIGTIWTKPTGLKYVIIEAQGAGQGGEGVAFSGSNVAGSNGKDSAFGSHCIASGADTGNTDVGDLIIPVGKKNKGAGSSAVSFGGGGRDSMFGRGSAMNFNSGANGDNATGYGSGGNGGMYSGNPYKGGDGGGSGAYSRKKVLTASLKSSEVVVVGTYGVGGNSDFDGGNGSQGLVIVTEVYI